MEGNRGVAKANWSARAAQQEAEEKEEQYRCWNLLPQPPASAALPPGS